MPEPYWTIWNSTGATSASTDVWPAWTTGTATYTMTMYNTQAWGAWNPRPARVRPTPPPETPQEAWVRKRRAMIARNRSQARLVHERVAQRRAETLLVEHLDVEQARSWEISKEHLDVEQARSWEISKEFHVVTPAGNTYLIRRGHAGNVYRVTEDMRLTRFCFHAYHPDGPIPDEDHMLAQKLILETDEEFFLAEANVMRRAGT